MGLGGNINSMCKDIAKMLPLSDREKKLICLVADALHDQTDVWEDLLQDYELDAFERPIIQSLYDYDHRHELAEKLLETTCSTIMPEVSQETIKQLDQLNKPFFGGLDGNA